MDQVNRYSVGLDVDKKGFKACLKSKMVNNRSVVKATKLSTTMFMVSKNFIFGLKSTFTLLVIYVLPWRPLGFITKIVLCIFLKETTRLP